MRRTILGLVLAIYIMLVTLWAGKKSGAHGNPIISLAFYRFKKISFKDVCAYFTSQFAGAVIAVVLLSLCLNRYFKDSSLDYSRAKPQLPHTLMAGFVAEFIISFIFVSAVLFCLTARELEKYTGAIMGLLNAIVYHLRVTLFGDEYESHTSKSATAQTSTSGSASAGIAYSIAGSPMIRLQPSLLPRQL